MSRPAVESTLFRARRRLSEEYDELASGQRCLRIQSIIATASSGRLGARDTRRLARHVAHCQPCRRQALAAGVDSALVARRPLRERAIEKVAGLFPLPLLLGRRRGGPGDGWTSQLPMVSDQAAAGGAKLAAAVAIVVAGLGAGLGTQVARERGGDPAPRAVERVVPAASSTTTRLSAAVAAARSASDRGAAPAERTRTDSGERVGAGGRKGGRRTIAPAGTSGGSATLPRKVQDSAPEAPAAPTAPDTSSAPAAQAPQPKLELPKVQLPTVTVPESTTGSSPSLPTVDVSPTMDSVTQTVEEVPQTVEDVKDTVTQPVEDVTGLPLP